MRILQTFPLYHPSVGGSQEVLRQVSERLVAWGHEVTVATGPVKGRAARELNGVRIAEFDVQGNDVRGLSGDVQGYREFLRRGDFDVMLNYVSQNWTTDLALPLVGALPYPAVFAPVGMAGMLRAEYASYFARMPEAMRRYAHLLFHSWTFRDVAFAVRHGISHYSVIPNAASEAEFDAATSTFRARRGIPANSPLLLTVGSHTGFKGHGAAIEAFRRADIGEAHLVVVGNPVAGGCWRACQVRAAVTRVRTAGKKHVHLLDVPRAEVVEAHIAADLFVFASRVECSPIVLFEAMASGTPFLSSEAGNAAEIVEWSDAGVVVPSAVGADGWVDIDIDAMARAIERLWNDPAERARMGANGRGVWRERFTWEKVARQYEALFQRVAEGRASAAR